MGLLPALPAAGLPDWGARVVRGVVTFLFPPVCPLCRTLTLVHHHLCDSCREALPHAPENYCVRCGELTARPEAGCAGCLANPLAMDAAYFAFRYEGVVCDLIVGFKFSDHSEWATLLGNLFWERLGSALVWEEPDLVIPLPLHPRRLIGRRYNQSALLAGELAGRLQRPLVTNGLFRCRMTLPQTRLNARARMLNVQGAFAAVPARVRGRSVVLVDDVMTTGATMGVAVAALKKAGATRVAGVCLARVIPE